MPTLSGSGGLNFFNYLKNSVGTAKESLVIICPYIRSETLKKLLNGSRIKKISIITTWKLQDLVYGSSDIELYNFCKRNGYYIYLNDKVHLKAFLIDGSTCIFGSANITSKGLSLVDEYNYEILSDPVDLQSNELIICNKILNESILVDEKIFEYYSNELNRFEKPKSIPDIDIRKILPKKEFLISSLPMSSDIDELFEIYSKGIHNKSKEKVHCAFHDIALYELVPGLSKKAFLDMLSKRFFESRFILRLLNIIDEDGMYFGRVKEWIQNNCTDVPVPSRRSLTGNIQVLYKWIVRLSDGKYLVDRPNYSERIYRAK